MESEYDYYYLSHNRNELISTISSAYHEIEGKKFKFSIISEKSLKPYVTNKKDNKANPKFAHKKIDPSFDIDEYLSQNMSAQGELNHNGVVAPKLNNKTVYSSHKK